MKERALVAFTLLAQLAVGAYGVLGAIYLQVCREVGPQTARLQTRWGFLAAAGLMVLAMGAALLHLGTPLLAWRALWNVRSSWLSREILATLLFSAASAAWAGLLWFDRGAPWVQQTVYWLGAVWGLALLLGMSWAYRLRTVPAWDTWATPASFLTTALLLGGPGAWMAVAAVPHLAPPPWLPRALPLGVIGLLSGELLCLPLWLAGLAGRPGAAAESLRRLTREGRALFQGRLVLIIVGIALAGALLTPPGAAGGLLLAATFLVLLIAEILGRVLFYAAYAREGV